MNECDLVYFFIYCINICYQSAIEVWHIGQRLKKQNEELSAQINQLQNGILTDYKQSNKGLKQQNDALTITKWYIY